MILIIFVGIALFILVATIFVPRTLGKDIAFEITKGETVRDIALNLKKKGLLHTVTYFRLYTFLTGTYDELQAGTYVLREGMRTGEIVKKFTRGDVFRSDLVFTIIPGWTIRDIADELARIGIASSADVRTYFSHNQKFEYQFLSDKPQKVPGYEGYLYPDTYFLDSKDTLEDVAKKIFTNFDLKLDGVLYQHIATQKKSMFEVVVMASILEKEVRILEDKRIVAGLLYKRMRAGMPLQVDATLVYVTGKTSAQLTIKDLALNSPYNTYVNRGLPMGPIGNPGRESLEAALSPKDSPYWYYLSKNDGTTVFSKTFEEHTRAKQKYLR